MQAEAIAKLRTEIEGSKNPAVQAIGQFLLQHLEQNPEDASGILNTDKTIGKSLEAMRKIAEKKKVGNVAVLSDAEGFAIVLEYFKREEPAAAAAPTEQPESEASNQAAVEKNADPAEEDFDFDELLK